MKELLAVAMLGLALAACAPEPAEPAETYSSRGVVRQLPRAGQPGSELQIHHEAVPEFRNEEGEVVGMESMVMPFFAAEDVPLSELAAGDRIAFEFEMRWSERRPLLITGFEKLPPETRLAFEAPSGEPDGAPPGDR